MPVPHEVRQSNLRTSIPFCLPSFRILSFCVALLALTTANVYSQEPVNDDDIVRVSTDLLLFPVRIKDKKGQPVSGLTQNDLSVKDPDHVTSGLYFLPGADHVALLFALDRSGSLRQIIAQQREAALALFGRFSDRSSIAIQTFAERPNLVAPFQKGTDAASSAFRFAPAINQHTAIFDAAAAALKTFESLPPNRSERRIVILISDGLDNASSTNPKDVIDAAIEKRISFYVIHLPLFAPSDGHLAVRPPSKGFRDLGEKTGGKYFLVGDVKTALLPDKSNDLTPVFKAIEDDLRSQYLLGFYMNEASRDGRRHNFSLSLVPPGIEYSVGARGYSRTQKFLVQVPKGNPQ
jgi:Ca-activated chloride channel family protein